MAVKTVQKQVRLRSGRVSAGAMRQFHAMSGRLVQVRGDGNEATVEAEPLETRFERLSAKWSRETAFISSTTKIVSHPAYRQIIEMGKAAIPLILRELQTRGGHWFFALKEITGEDPTSAEEAGYYDRLREEWLAWGQKRNYL